MDVATHGRVSISEAEAKRAYRVLQAVWIVASAKHKDAIADDVERLGETLKAAIDASDWQAARTATEDCRRWLQTMAGVINSRMTRVFEL